MLRKVLFVFLFCLTVAGTAQAVFPDPPVPYTHTVAVAQGPWDDPATWQRAPGVTDALPGDGAVVHIPAGRRVTVRRQEPARLSFIRVDGEMRLWIHSDTRILVETIYVGPYDPGQPKTGIFMIGARCCPVKPGRTAEVIFISDGVPLWEKTSWDPKQLSRGLVSDGQIRLFGQPKKSFYTVSHDAPAGTTTLDLDLDAGETVPRGWEAGDEIVLTGTYFRRTGEETSSQDELRSLIGQPTSGTVSIAALDHDHLRPAPDLHLHAANLRRNLVLRSESTAIPDRAHLMFRHPDVFVQGALFMSLGRTDKTVPLDDLLVDAADGTVSVPAPADIRNPRGRYAVHFHENGIQPEASEPPSKIWDSVVYDTPGWGFVNHSSHVDFQRNVAWVFAGAAFVTEAGNELGNFVGNIAIRGRGNGQYRTVRIVFKNGMRPQPLADFGFSGDGFWFQGPAIRVRDNVASGCDGAGMIWFTTGAPDPGDIGPDDRNRYSGFDRGDAEAVYGVSTSDPSFTPRYWDHGVANEKLVISDLPILEFSGFEGYANLIGLKIRFNNHDNVDLYNEDPYDYDQDIVPLLPGDRRYAKRLRQRIEDLVLWNNEQGLRTRYNVGTDWKSVRILNHLDYDTVAKPFFGHVGAEFNFQLQSQTLDQVEISGYPVAGWMENANDNVRNQFTTSSLDYDEYAQFDTWNKNGLSCSSPFNLVASVSGQDANLSWVSSNLEDERYLVRYRPSDEVPWTQLDTDVTQVSVGQLELATEYRFQVVAGCCQPDAMGACGPGELRSVSPWSEEAGFTTQ